MSSLFMVRTPGTKDFPTLAHLKERRIYTGVAKDDAERLIDAGLAEWFDEDNEDHASAYADYGEQDAKKSTVKTSPALKTPKPGDYEVMTVEQLHQEAAKRELEGRSGLTTKADLIKALTKDDAKGKPK